MPSAPDIGARQRAEIEFWRDSKDESPECDSLTNLTFKMSEARIFLDCLERHRQSFASEGRVLELGAGQGWASCIYKKLFPIAHVTATDISEFAIMSVPKWERIFSVHLDNAYACVSYEINEPDSSIDRVFCYASAHHFLAHRRTLIEIMRVLKPGGVAFYFYEPATPGYLYSLAKRRVNRRRPAVQEDVLITSKIWNMARGLGFGVVIDHYPSTTCRTPVEAIYYCLLARISILQKILPCSVNLVFTKPGGRDHEWLTRVPRCF